MFSLLQRSLRARLVFYGVSLFALVGGGIILASAYQSFHSVQEQVAQSAKESARNYGVIVGDFVNNALRTAVTTRDTVALGREAGVLSRHTIGVLAPGIVAANKPLLGITIGFEPNGLDGNDAEYVGSRDFSTPSGRYAPYFYRTGDGSIVFEEADDMVPNNPEDEEWYTRPMRENQTMLTPPYTYPLEGKDVLMVTSTSIIHEKSSQKPIGVVAVDITLQQLQEELSRYKPMGVGTVSLLGHTQTWVAHTDPKKVAQQETDKAILALASEADQANASMGHISTPTGEMFTLAVPVHFFDAKQVWTVFVSIPQAHITALVMQGVWKQAVIGALLVLLGALAFFRVGTQFSTPISKLTGLMTRVSQNELEVAIPYTERRDEIGHMAQSLRTFRDRMRETAALRAEQEAQKARAEETRRAMLRQLADDFERDVQSIVTSVSTAAAQLAARAQEMTQHVMASSSLAGQATEAAHETSGNVQSIASAAEELSASIGEISSQLQRTTALVQQSSEQTHHADSLAVELRHATDKVSEVMEIISGIASQINLLALNATIESARAGEAGKGFAVVAGEVKNLASQTDRSIAGIREMVNEMRHASENIVNALSGITASASEITGATAGIASAVEEQSATTSEIARSMQHAAAGTQLISGNLGEVHATSAQAGDGATQMLNASHALSEQAERLHAQVDLFLKNVRKDA